MPPYFTMRPGRPDLSAIEPGLLVGGYPALDDIPWLARVHGVTAVVSLQDDTDLAAKRLDARALDASYAAAGMPFVRLPVPDGDEARLAHVVPVAMRHIATFRHAGHVVYLHCNAGMNRAPTVAIAYLHVHGGHDLGAATTLVKTRRPCVPFQALLERLYG